MGLNTWKMSEVFSNLNYYSSYLNYNRSNLIPMKLKYKINELIDNQPRYVDIESIVAVLEKDYKISRSTFLRDRNTLLHDESSIPTDRLEIYAGLLGVSTDQLKNYPHRKIKPLSERKLSQLSKTIIKKSKLTKG